MGWTHERGAGTVNVDELILRVLRGTATSSEEERLVRWRGQAAENEAAFREAQAVWRLTAPGGATAPAPTVRQIARRAEERRRHAVPLPQRSNRPGRRIAGVAAALAAAIAAVALGVHLWSPGVPMAVYVAAETPTAVLSDGSFVRLATGSRLEERMLPDRREVVLEGRAFFAVAHDAARPFVVREGSGSVRVLGTRFELSGTADSLRVVVVEGRVEMATGAGAVEVPRGSVGWAAGDAAPRTAVADDVYGLMDWPDGILVYRGTPLTEVAAEVARRFGHPVRVEGDALGSRRVSGAFVEEAFQDVVESLCVVTGATCVPAGDGFVMRPRGTGGAE